MAPKTHTSSQLSEKKSKGRSGQSLVEFTLIMPFLLMVVTGMLSFGLVMHNHLVLTNGVNIGAQTLSMSRGQTTDPCATVYSAIQSSSPSLVSSNLALKFVINGTTYTSSTCSTGSSNMVQGATVDISASYPCAFAVYGMSGGCNLTSRTAEIIQ